MLKKGTLPYLVNHLENTSIKDSDDSLLWYSVRGSINPKLLISNLSETLRSTEKEVEKVLEDTGFGDFVAEKNIKSALSDSEESSFVFLEDSFSYENDLISVEFTPNLNDAISISKSLEDLLGKKINSLCEFSRTDPFLSLYRDGVVDYHDNFIKKEGALISNYIAQEIPDLKYIVTSGIGANEQFSHFVADYYNSHEERKFSWFIVNSPYQLRTLPSDSTTSNTLFMEFSRSGKTEETIKIHEYTSREAKRIVFANSGPLRELGERDNNLVLDLPDKVSGRFGRNTTPILLAPMHVLGLDTRRYWDKINETIDSFPLGNKETLPMLMASFIYTHQLKNKINHVYFGCNDNLLKCSANELIQFWNEGVNKNENDISMSSYFGLLRDSHANVEGLLSNAKTKMGIFLLPEELKFKTNSSLINQKIDPINPNHNHLKLGEEEQILAYANYCRFSEVMPCIKITTIGDLGLDHSAMIGQLWADLTYCYSRLVNVDPGSNPEVKQVRDRAVKLLSGV
jgi:hypothetical protein